MERKTPILKLLRRNILALISLTLAIVSLSYNTWRNDATELNRNQRAAGFAAFRVRSVRARSTALSRRKL